MSEEQKQQDRSLDLYIVLSRAHRSVTEYVYKDIAKSKLNPTEFAVLELLYHKGPHPLQQIGDKILLASGSITYVVDKLENKGYLVREHHEKDRRIIYAKATDKGKALMDRIFPQHAAVIREALSGLNDNEKLTAIELLKKLGLSVDKHYEL